MKERNNFKKIPKLDSFVAKKQNKENCQVPEACTFTGKIQSELTGNLEVDTNLKDEQNKRSNDKHSKDDNIIEKKSPNLSSDLGSYLNKNISNKDERLLIMNYNKPNGRFPKDANQNNRCFSKLHYSSTTKYGPVPRIWLCYSNVFDAAYCHYFQIFRVSGVTVASVERSFSKLKIIKDSKRNSIEQTRLQDVALSSIEHKEAAKMDIKELINDFANAKARRKQF